MQCVAPPRVQQIPKAESQDTITYLTILNEQHIHFLNGAVLVECEILWHIVSSAV